MFLFLLMRDEFRRICLSKITLITASSMPKPDLETTGLVARLSAVGCEAAQLTWDSEVDWSGYDLIVLRTPWDYVERLQEFLTWIRRVDETTKLLNPAATIGTSTSDIFSNFRPLAFRSCLLQC